MRLQRICQPLKIFSSLRKPFVPWCGLSTASTRFNPGVKKRPPNGPKPLPKIEKLESSDHRELGTQLSLFTGHPSSPGSPFFLPDGAHVFQKLQSFLRAQYPSFGFREVITPDLYKRELWENSGHWQNYKDAMFQVGGKSEVEDSDNANYSLKPMNCPGHCLLYKTQTHSFRELPIRYADFSPLHRNEVSGALSGLTRVRRFHQDDGHIFCKPDQIKGEIQSTLQFVDMAYTALNISSYNLVLSTRPEKEYIGTLDQWQEAEEQLRQALVDSGRRWERNHGDGAFYGPKIDISLTDADGKQHQTATIQLDFQLPQRFGLEYDITAKEKGTPVLIHRAIFGSLERFMALMIEKYRGHWPFWLSPRQMIILTVGDDPKVLNYARKTALELTRFIDAIDTQRPQPLYAPTYLVDTDLRNETIAKKTANAKTKKYNLICFIGERNVKDADYDIDITGQSNQEKTIKAFNQARPGTLSPVQGVLAHKIRRGTQGVKLDLHQLKLAMRLLTERYL